MSEEAVELTPRQTEVLKLISQGYFNKQIAAEMRISEQTVKNHVRDVLSRLHAYNRAHAVLLAKERGIL